MRSEINKKIATKLDKECRVLAWMLLMARKLTPASSIDAIRAFSRCLFRNRLSQSF
jgi:hypothetical protein